MKHLRLTLCILTASVIMFSCNSGGSSASSSMSSDSTKGDSSSSAMRDSMHSTTDSSSSMSMTANSSPEQNFINIAVPANMKEMAWLNAGISKGSKQIKDDAEKMLKDHKKLGADVQNYLSSKPNLKAPSVDTSNVVTINDKSGKDFDKAWTDKMVDDHTDLLMHLHETDSLTKDPDLKKLVSGAIPVVQSHLNMAKKLQSGMK